MNICRQNTFITKKSKDYLYNDKLTKEQNILMDRLYKLRMSGMAEAFEKQLLEPNTGLEEGVLQREQLHTVSIRWYRPALIENAEK